MALPCLKKACVEEPEIVVAGSEETKVAETNQEEMEDVEVEEEEEEEEEEEDDDEDDDEGEEEDLRDWPLGKFQSALAALPESAMGAVILTTGAMNPVHKGHVELLEKAKEELERHGYTIVGLWVSPSHDGYVQPKCRHMHTVGLSADFRLEVARRSVLHETLVEVGTWEAKTHGHWPDFPIVAEALQRHIDSRHSKTTALKGPNGFTRVFYACGTDHAKKCGLYRGLKLKRDMGVVVVPRAGEFAHAANHRLNVYIAQPAHDEVAALSSTFVRQKLKERDFDAVAKAMSEDAARLLLHPTPEEHELFKVDFAKIHI